MSRNDSFQKFKDDVDAALTLFLKKRREKKQPRVLVWRDEKEQKKIEERYKDVNRAIVG